MVDWRFADAQEDGEAWLRNPDVFHAYVDYQVRGELGRSEQRRVMVVTKGWLDSQVAGVRKSSTGPLWAAIPSMVVLPDAEGEELRRIVQDVVQQGGLDQYSTVLQER